VFRPQAIYFGNAESFPSLAIASGGSFAGRSEKSFRLFHALIRRFTISFLAFAAVRLDFAFHD
jgi:hypothetical protein